MCVTEVCHSMGVTHGWHTVCVSVCMCVCVCLVYFTFICLLNIFSSVYVGEGAVGGGLGGPVGGGGSVVREGAVCFSLFFLLCLFVPLFCIPVLFSLLIFRSDLFLTFVCLPVLCVRACVRACLREYVRACVRA